MPKKLLKIGLFLFSLPIDIVLALGWIISAIPAVFIARCRPPSERHVIFLAPGADIEAMHQKFGTLNVYLLDDPDFFEKTYRFLWGKINCKLRLRNNYTVIERRVRLPLPFSGIASLFGMMTWVVAIQRINIIHARDPYFCGLVAWGVARLCGCLFCVSIHSDYDKRYKLDGTKGAPTVLGSRAVAKLLEHFVLSRSDLVMPIREHLGKKAIEDGAAPERIRIIPHGINLSTFNTPIGANVRDKLSLPVDKAILSFVGRFSNENYVNDILMLVSKLAEKRADFIIVMAGGGYEEQRLRRQWKEDSILQKHLCLPGFLIHEDAIALRRSSSLSLCLMAGFSLIEACAAGRPVIAYDIEWHHELVKTGETGFLVKEADVDGLVEAVQFLLDNPEEAKQMGKSARELAFERHDIKRTASTKRAYYQELIEMRRGGVDGIQKSGR